MKPKRPIEQEEQLARRRAALIVQVQCGQITVTEAAAQLGVSRKTYYEWEKRALNAMVSALQDRTGGRPATRPEALRETLPQQTRELQEQVQVLEQTLVIRQQLAELEWSKKNS